MLFSRIPSVTPEEAAARLAVGELALVDVREQAELGAGRVRGARNIPLGQLGARLRELDGDRQIAFLCRSGARSSRATRIAAKAGLRRGERQRWRDRLEASRPTADALGAIADDLPSDHPRRPRLCLLPDRR